MHHTTLCCIVLTTSILTKIDVVWCITTLVLTEPILFCYYTLSCMIYCIVSKQHWFCQNRCCMVLTTSVLVDRCCIVHYNIDFIISDVVFCIFFLYIFVFVTIPHRFWGEPMLDSGFQHWFL